MPRKKIANSHKKVREVRPRKITRCRAQIVSINPGEVILLIKGVRYRYQLSPPNVRAIEKFTWMFQKNRGKAISYLKRVSDPATIIEGEPIQMSQPRRVIEEQMGGSRTGRITTQRRHPSCMVPPEIDNSPNITIHVVMPANTGQEFLEYLDRQGANVHHFFRMRAKAFMRQNKSYDLGDQISFGQYMGENIETVIQNDPKYIAWALDAVNNFQLSDALEELLLKTMEGAKFNSFHPDPF